jgi:hypothetical protein
MKPIHAARFMKPIHAARFMKPIHAVRFMKSHSCKSGRLSGMNWSGVCKPFVLCLLPLALAGCARELDQFAPQIVIVRPKSDITPNSSVMIEGYAWDDKGIIKLTINGKTDLLAKGEFASQYGRKIVRFKFPAKDLVGNALKYELRAVDASRNAGSRTISVTVDTKKPIIEIQGIESQLDSVVVRGQASDNRKVQTVFINGEPMNVSPGSEVQFYRVVRRSRATTISVRAVDGVGNEASRIIAVPLPPPPPEPVVDENNRQGNTPSRPTRDGTLRRNP